MTTPRFSICVPSRNRQFYFQNLIAALAKSERRDVQFVLADNSDEPEIMNTFMQAYAGDPRIVYLPSQDRTLAMVDNWERTMEAATGDWITFIGDDDYADPDFADLAAKLAENDPTIDAVCWSSAAYIWPSESRGKIGVFVPAEAYVVKYPRDELQRRMFGWNGATHTPSAGFSVYHSAISRKLMDRIKATFGGRYFEHPVVDYDNAFKVIAIADNFGFSRRPFSVMGSCPKSNSNGCTDFSDFRKKTEVFIREAGRDYLTADGLGGFPFKSMLGTSATILETQHWFKETYKRPHDGWEINFAKAATRDVEKYQDREMFDLAANAYAAAFKAWKGGKYAGHFAPEFKPEVRPEFVVTSGFTENGFYIDQEIAGTESAAGIFEVMRGLMRPADQMEVPKGGLKFFWDALTPEQRARRA
jgi:glycosyltransferase involved in cell wall biosynthesis